MGLRRGLPPVGTSLVSAWVTARSKYPELVTKWISLSHTFGGSFGASDGWSLQIAGDIDLMLRCMEDDLVAEFAGGVRTDDASMMAVNLQAGLSRMWVLDLYEAVRWACSTDRGKEHDQLNALHGKLKLARIPLAKGEIANTNRGAPRIELVRQGDDPSKADTYVPGKTRYRPGHIFNRDTGSCGWSVVDPKAMRNVELLRRDLSDELLVTFD